MDNNRSNMLPYRVYSNGCAGFDSDLNVPQSGDDGAVLNGNWVSTQAYFDTRFVNAAGPVAARDQAHVRTAIATPFQSQAA